MNVCMTDIPGDLDFDLAADITKIFKDILIHKILEKNQKYGNSVYEPAKIFADNDLCPIDAICIRVDDKLKRMEQLDRCSEKFESEVKEIIAYLLILLDIKGRKKDETTGGC